jgi:Kef-type K+ transport system membrane component KefB
MKAIQNCLQKIVIYKIYSLEKQKMEYNDNEVYNHIGVGFLIVFSYIVIILLFLSVRLFNELRNNSTLVVCVTILCFSAKYFFVKHLKQKKYVQAIHKEYLQMDLKKRKENYKNGLYYVVFVILFPLFSILVMELIEFITDN